MFTFSPADAHAKPPEDVTAYAFAFKTLIGNEAMPLEQHRGKVLLIVNTASHCGFTKQYEGLQALYERYQSRGLVVLGVPSNDFGAQEKGSADEIARFCKLNYGVTFPMAAKEVIVGEDAHPFYQWARQSLGYGSAPKWNFHKYLIDRQGRLIDHFHSTTAPGSGRLRKAVEHALADGQ